jgi:hypothetical protein
MDEGSRELLERALDLFNDRPNFGLRRDPLTTSYKLVSDIERHVEPPQSRREKASVRFQQFLG